MKPVQRRNAAIISALSSNGAFPRHADEEQHLQSSINTVNKETHLNLLWPKYKRLLKMMDMHFCHLTSQCFETDKPTERNKGILCVR